MARNLVEVDHTSIREFTAVNQYYNLTPAVVAALIPYGNREKKKMGVAQESGMLNVAWP